MSKDKRSKKQTETQAEKAYDAIKGAILRGRIREGEFLREADIMKEFGIGRTPYREACNRLNHEGLLEVLPRRGYFVPELSFQSVRDLFEVRLLLEGTIAELAAARATDEEIDELAGMAQIPVPSRQSPPDFERSISANTQFHLLLARMSRNRELENILRGILERTERLMHIELRRARPRSSAASISEHMPIVAALRKHDPAAARKAVIQDIHDAQRATLGEVPALSGANGHN